MCTAPSGLGFWFLHPPCECRVYMFLQCISTIHYYISIYKYFYKSKLFLGKFICNLWMTELISCLTVWLTLWVMCLMTYKLALQWQETFLCSFFCPAVFVYASISNTLLHCRHKHVAARKANSGKWLRWKVPGFYAAFCSTFIFSLRFVKSRNQSAVLYVVPHYTEWICSIHFFAHTYKCLFSLSMLF